MAPLCVSSLHAEWATQTRCEMASISNRRPINAPCQQINVTTNCQRPATTTTTITTARSNLWQLEMAFRIFAHFNQSSSGRLLGSGYRFSCWDSRRHPHRNPCSISSAERVHLTCDREFKCCASAAFSHSMHVGCCRS